MIYAVHRKPDRVHFEPLCLVHDWDSANDVVGAWHKSREDFNGDFVAAWNSELWIFTQQPMCPVVWRICQGEEIL